MTLVIMAAGMGSRFGGLKQIEPVNENNEFIIDYSIYDAIKAGFTKIVFIIKKENYDIFRDTVGKRVEKHIDVEYVFQELTNVPEGYKVPEDRVKPLGTAHAILCCKDVVKENFAIINADDFYGRDAYMVMGKFLKENTDETKYAMAGYKVKNTLTENGAVKRGICETENEYLVKLVESSVEQKGDKIMATPLDTDDSFEVGEDTLVSMNMFGFTKKLFDHLEEKFVTFLDNNIADIKSEFFIPNVVFELIGEGKATVEVLKTNAVWQGITYKEDKEDLVNGLKELTQKGEYPSKLWD